MPERTIASQLGPALKKVRDALMAVENAVAIVDERDERSLDDWGHAGSAIYRLEDAVEDLRKRAAAETRKLEDRLDEQLLDRETHQ